MRLNPNVWRLLALVTCTIPLTMGYKVLFIPAPAGSHLVLLSNVAEAWVKAGHKADVLKHHSVPIPSQYQNSSIRYFPFGKPGEQHFTLSKNFTESVGQMSQKGMIETITTLVKMFNGFCEEYLKEDGLHERLVKEKYDFVLVDMMPGGLDCLHAMPHRLSVPYGTLGVMAPIDMLGTTLQINYLGTTLPPFYSKQPGFWQRLGQFRSYEIMALLLIAAVVIFAGVKLYQCLCRVCCGKGKGKAKKAK